MTTDRPLRTAAISAGENWAGNHTYTAGRYVRAGSLQEAQEVIASSKTGPSPGTRHSFNAFSDTDGTLLDLTGLTSAPVLDEAAASVRVPSGIPYRDLAPYLQARGHALANMGSLPHISVAGATSTGTQGSGTANRILGASVRRVELIDTDGELRTVSRGEPEFDGPVVALGAVGAVATLTSTSTSSRPTRSARISMTTSVGRGRRADRRGLASAYSVSVFGRWNNNDPTEVLVKTRVTPATRILNWMGGTPAIAAEPLSARWATAT